MLNVSIQSCIGGGTHRALGLQPSQYLGAIMELFDNYLIGKNLTTDCPPPPKLNILPQPSNVCILTFLEACPVYKMMEIIVWRRPICWFLCFNKRPAAITTPISDDVLDRKRREAASSMAYNVGALLFSSAHKLCHLNSKSRFMVVILNKDVTGFFVHSNEHSALTTYTITTWSKTEYPLYDVRTFVTSARVDCFSSGTRSILRAVYEGFL
jgi:hypothetical protein